MEQQPSFFVKYLPMEIYLTATKQGELPAYLGSTLRGAIGRVLYSNTPLFNYLYNNRSFSQNQQDVVNPYVIVPPQISQQPYHQGEGLQFKLLLLGEAESHGKAVVDALTSALTIELGALRNPFILKKITQPQNQRIIWEKGDFNENGLVGTVVPYKTLQNVKKATIRFKTPLRIRRNGELLTTINFETVIRNIIQRITAITQRYGGWVDKAAATEIQKLATTIVTAGSQLNVKAVNRYSNRIGDKMDFSGLLGAITFEGNLSPFVPWLCGGQVLHIGRNTTFGMGKIEVEFI